MNETNPQQAVGAPLERQVRPCVDPQTIADLMLSAPGMDRAAEAMSMADKAALLVAGKAVWDSALAHCKTVCQRVQAYHEAKAEVLTDVEEAEFRQAEACGAEDCAEAISMGEPWFAGPNGPGEPGAR